jgi:hypothetical protein
MAPDILVVAIEIGEPELADRLTALLADVPGLRLAAAASPPMRRLSSRRP